MTWSYLILTEDSGSSLLLPPLPLSLTIERMLAPDGALGTKSATNGLVHWMWPPAAAMCSAIFLLMYSILVNFSYQNLTYIKMESWTSLSHYGTLEKKIKKTDRYNYLLFHCLQLQKFSVALWPLVDIFLDSLSLILSLFWNITALVAYRVK